ncbi:MAG: fibronectin type III domain-containing protein, partial [Usitatibacteraceae bacterium]
MKICDIAERTLRMLALLTALHLLALGAPVHAQSAADGANIWVSRGCSNSSCHGSTPTGARVNAADPGGSAANTTAAKSIFNNAISNVGGMNKYANGGSQDLSETEKESLILYLESVFGPSPINTSTSFETAKQINVSADVAFGATSGLSALSTGANAVNHGSVSYNNSTRVITYTPTGGWVGDDTFSYKACNSGATLCTADRTITVTTNPPPVPVITSSLTKNGTVGISLTYNITASNGPNSFSATSLPPGLSRSGSVISGVPTTFDTVDTAFLSATNEGGTGPTATLTFNIAKGNPNLDLPTPQIPSSQFYRPGTTFVVNPLASSPSTGAITYSVSPSNVCTNSGGSATITKVGVGNCAIVAQQVADANWNSDTSLTRTVTINPAVQTLTFPIQSPDFYPFVANSTFPIDPVTASGGSGNPVVYSPANAAVCTVSGTTVTMVSAGDCVLRANQAGSANYSAANQVTQLVVLSAGEPDAPVLTSITGGDTRATVFFNPPPNPGSPITLYTATCNLGGGSLHAGTSNASPVVVTGLSPNGAPWACNVTATNAIGTSDASNMLGVTPLATPVGALVRSANNVTFTVGVAKSFQVVATGTPNPTVFRSGTAPPSGVTFT